MKDFLRVIRPFAVLLPLALLVGVAPASADEGERKTAERPHLLLIVIDTLRADRLSAYGHERETSPTIDRLAAEGVLYEEAISAAPWTLPAHASLFTGLFPRQHRTTSQSWTLPRTIPTLAELLRDAGYRTGGFSNNVWTNDQTGLRRGFEDFFPLYEKQNVRSEGISADDPDTDMGGKLTNDTVLEWIDDASQAKGDDRPFFVFINYFEPHLPFRPPRPYDRSFLPEDATEEEVRRLRSFYSPREYGYILRSPLTRVSERDLEILAALYDAEVRYSDWVLGRLLDGLEERGVLEDTVIAVTSDHGEHLGENHMLSHKLSVYDPLLEVPLVLWNPERLPDGVRVETPVQAHDVFGTFLHLAGVEPPEGTPRLPIPGRADVPPRTHTFAELAYPEIFLKVAKKKVPGWPTEPFERALTTVRQGRWKLIVGSDGSVELYDLEADPREENNLALENPEKVEELEAVLERFRSGEI